MNAENNEDRIFAGARAIGDPQKRLEFIRSECGTDMALFKRLMALVHAADGNSSFLESPPAAILETRDLPGSMEKTGDSIGRYKLLQKIGEGGFGVVYMAEQHQPMRRKVALKIIKPGMDSREVVVRFEAERQALALMDHPNIARVFDGGMTSTGRPYFVMELVKGIPLTQFCDENRIDTANRLKLFAEICKAIQHAHQKGVIHRDIKPSNVMVTMHDGTPVPKVIDFGVSKAISQQLTEKTLFTAYGQMIGTPQYMSPEQAELSGLDIDTRSDIYSLGVLLYELLTGTTPLDVQSLRGKALAEMQRMIRESEATAPSLRLTTRKAELVSIAAQRNTEPKKLSALVRGELDWIVLKALEKNRNRRYETAIDMAHDVERYLHNEPVQACPPTLAYRLTKTFRKHRLAVAVAAALFLSMAGGLATTLWQYQNAARQAALAIDARESADAARKDAIDKSEQLQISVERLTEAKNVATQALADRGEALTRSEALRLAAQSSAEIAKDPGLAMLLAIEGAKLLPDSAATNNAMLAAMDACREIRTFEHPSDARVTNAIFSPDQKLILAVESTRVVIWEVETGRMVTVFDPKFRLQNVQAKFSPDNRHIAVYGKGGSICQHADGTAEGFTDHVVRIWDVVDGQETMVLRGHSQRVSDIVFDRSGKRLATASWDGTARIWNLETGDSVKTFEFGTSLETVIFSPNEDMLIAGKSQDNFKSYIMWEDGSTQPPSVIDPPIQFVRRIDSAGTTILKPAMDGPTGSGAGTHTRPVEGNFPALIRWNIESGEVIDRIQHVRFENVERMEAIAKGEESQLLVTNGQTVLLWDLKSHSLVAECQELSWNLFTEAPPLKEMTLQFEGDRAEFQKRCIVPHRVIEFLTLNRVSPDGKLAVNSSGETIHLTNTEIPNMTIPMIGHHGEHSVQSILFSNDGTMVLSAGDHTVRLWDATGVGKRKHRASTPMLESIDESFHIYLDINDVSFSPDGSLVATAGRDSYVRLFDSANGNQIAAMLGNEDVDRMASNRSGIAGVVTNLFNGHSSDPTELRQKTIGNARSVRFSPDGNRLLAITEDPFATLIGKPDDGKPNGLPVPLPFLPARVWDVASGKLSVACPGNEFKGIPTESGNLAGSLAWGFASAVFANNGLLVVTVDDHNHNHSELDANGRGVSTSWKSGISIAKSDDGKPLAPFFAIRCWDANNGKLIRVIPSEIANSRCYVSENGERCLIEDQAGFRIVNPTTGEDVCRLDERVSPNDYPVVFSPDNQWMYVVSDDAVWNIVTGKLAYRMSPPSGADAGPGQDAEQLSTHKTRPQLVRFTPDSRLIVTASSDTTAHVWDAATGKHLGGFFGHTKKIGCMNVSPDSQWCITGSADETARVWSLQNHLERVSLPFDSEITAVAFDATGTRIVTAAGGVAQVWPLEVLSAAESRAPRKLTADERKRFEIGAIPIEGK